jgi:hypothetical protein
MSTEETKTVDPLDNDEVNKAAYDFMMTSKQARAFARNMKAGSLSRVFTAVMEFPFNNDTPKFVKKEENELFLMCLSMFRSKQVMSEALAKNQEAMQQIQQEASAKVAEEIITESKGE